MSVSVSMERGQVGRIVDTFASAKDRGEAALESAINLGNVTLIHRALYGGKTAGKYFRITSALV